MKKVLGLVIGLLPVSAFAECVPVPDCASIGYTETSCDGDSLKCPFDTTKLYCPPCDSSFRYSCDGENITNPIGNACNNKYAACNCIAGATFSNGECICDTSCNTIGNIYYSDGSCNSCLDENKTAIGVIVGISPTIISSPLTVMYWAPILVSVNSNYTGKENTTIIVEHFGEDAENVAGVYCYNYAPPAMLNTKKQWYMPSLDELTTYILPHLEKIITSYNLLGADTKYKRIWSSSNAWTNSGWYLELSTGTTGNQGKYSNNFATCFLEL